MNQRIKRWMWISTEKSSEPGVGFPHAQIEINHVDVLGKLMESSYKNSADYDGETFESCVQEATAVIQGKYGPFISSASLINFQGTIAASAILITNWENSPLLVHCVTDPEFQGQGRSGYLIRKAVARLKSDGYSDLYLLVADNNLPAMNLYLKLGFQDIGQATPSKDGFEPPKPPISR